jgi:serine/threonine protein kinase/tetratricopeptide (TPR) repeat protein
MAEANPRTESLFWSALAIPSPEERARYLDQACGGDPQLRGRLEELLAAYPKVEGFLEPPARRPVATVDEPLGGERPGTAVGPYKLLEPIGEGGMGTVWMAQQTEPVKRLVALKLIKAGMDSRQVIARFEAERQALALMDHANIARVLDAGATGAGRPYFVMDLVKGVPITRYCDEHRLTPRQRLELFLPVCQAIQHAHQKGVIHRDLKPSNVLVALYDGRPVPKVIDFGVAKAAGPQLTDKTLVTGFGALVGTLEYMSPEQAEINQLDVDTRSDVYSLGVLLYELLTGNPPFTRQEQGKGGVLEMLRVIREQEPTKPSAKLSTAEGLPALAANRGTEPAKLTRLVRGELDWIVLKALEKDRNRRYETATGFAMDVQRYLADEPVQACPPSAGYRLRKFVRRNRGPVAAASVMLFCLVAGIVGTTAGLVWAVQERDDKAKALDDKETALIAETRESKAKVKALGEEIKARRAARQAHDKALDALRDMTDEIVEDQMARGTHLTEENKEFLRKILKHFEGFAAVTAGDAESRAIRAEGYYRVGLMRDRLGELKEAEAGYREALALRKQLAAEFPDRPEVCSGLARCHTSLGALLQDTGRLKEAETAYGDALALLKPLTARFPARPELRHGLAASHYNLGVLLQDRGRLTEAEAAYRDALALREALADEFPTRPALRHDLAASHNNLGNLLRAVGRLGEAAAAYQDALALRRQLAADFPTRPEFRAGLARSQAAQGTLLQDTGRLTEAEAAFGEALAFCKRLAAEFPARPELRLELARGFNNLGGLFQVTGRLKDAEAAQADALALCKQLADDFPARPEFRQDLALSHFNQGNLLRTTGRLKEAAAAYRDALALREALAAEFPTRPELRSALSQSQFALGILLQDTGRLKDAAAAYAEALALIKPLAAEFPARPDFRDERARIHNNLGNLLRATGRPTEANAHLDDALALYKALAAEFPARPDFRQGLAVCRHNLGFLLRAEGRPTEAEAAYREALAQRRQLADEFPARPEFRQDLAVSHNNLGMLLRDTGRPKEAEAAFREALALRKQLADAFPARPDFRADLAGSYNNLGALLQQTGRPKEAEAPLTNALALFKQLVADFPTRPQFRLELAGSHNNLGNLLRILGRPKEAEAPLADALALYKQLAAEFPGQPDLWNCVALAGGNLALLRLEQRDFQAAKARLSEAGPHNEAALKANPRHPDYQQCYRSNLGVLIRVNAGLGDRAAAQQAARKLRDFGGGPPGNAYEAARYLALCIPIVRRDDRASREERDRQAAFYGDEAMAMLRAAVARGRGDAAHVGADPALAPLHERDDFQKLLAELKAKQ